MPNGVEAIDETEAAQILEIAWEKDAARYEIKKNGEIVATTKKRARLYDLTESQIRLTIAEFAADKIFLHAGAVAWKGKALIFPASSFSGKTSLAAALIKRGALYYSDEYAVLNREGLVEPFAKTLSVRGVKDGFAQVERRAETFGGAAGSEPIPVGLVLLCKFDKREKKRRAFAPEILSAGAGALEILAHAVAARRNPKFVLEILNKISTRAIIAKCKRGEAEDFAELLIEFLETAF